MLDNDIILDDKLHFTEEFRKSIIKLSDEVKDIPMFVSFINQEIPPFSEKGFACDVRDLKIERFMKKSLSYMLDQHVDGFVPAHLLLNLRPKKWRELMYIMERLKIEFLKKLEGFKKCKNCNGYGELRKQIEHDNMPIVKCEYCENGFIKEEGI